KPHISSPYLAVTGSDVEPPPLPGGAPSPCADVALLAPGPPPGCYRAPTRLHVRKSWISIPDCARPDDRRSSLLEFRASARCISLRRGHCRPTPRLPAGPRDCCEQQRQSLEAPVTDGLSTDLRTRI